MNLIHWWGRQTGLIDCLNWHRSTQLQTPGHSCAALHCTGGWHKPRGLLWAKPKHKIQSFHLLSLTTCCFPSSSNGHNFFDSISLCNLVTKNETCRWRRNAAKEMQHYSFMRIHWFLFSNVYNPTQKPLLSHITMLLWGYFRNLKFRKLWK